MHAYACMRDGACAAACMPALQYPGEFPGEKEITFPPFTCLESDGDPRVERNARGEVVFFPLKVLRPLSHAITKLSAFGEPFGTLSPAAGSARVKARVVCKIFA